MISPLVYNGKELHAWDTAGYSYHGKELHAWDMAGYSYQQHIIALRSRLTLGLNPKDVFTRLWSRPNKLFYITLEPGDGTRYSFGVCLTDIQTLTIIQYVDDSFTEINTGFTCSIDDDVDFVGNRFTEQLNSWTFKVMKHYFKLIQEEYFNHKQ